MGHCLMMRKGEVHTAPVTGVLASSLAVGSTVKLMEGGTAVEYLVVNQGIPENSSLYDASCDGTWLLRKDIHSTRVWNASKNLSTYANSDINTWLNGTFFSSFGKVEQATIQQVKLPYVTGGGSTTVNSGAKGLATKAFLLGAIEVGGNPSEWSSASMQRDGALLSYFELGTGTSANNKRIAYLAGTAKLWWLRTPETTYSSTVDYAFVIMQAGSIGSDGVNQYNEYGIRPAVIVPKNALFGESDGILKGVK